MITKTLTELYLSDTIDQSAFSCLLAYFWVDTGYTDTATAPITIKESKKAGRYEVSCKRARKAMLLSQGYFKFTKEEYLEI